MLTLTFSILSPFLTFVGFYAVLLALSSSQNLFILALSSSHLCQPSAVFLSRWPAWPAPLVVALEKCPAHVFAYVCTHVYGCKVRYCNVMCCIVMSCHVMSCYVMSCYVVMLCYVSVYIYNISICVCVYVCMGARVHGRIGCIMHARMDGRTDGWMFVCVHAVWNHPPGQKSHRCLPWRAP